MKNEKIVRRSVMKKEPKKQLEHRLKLELMKTCMIYGKSFADTVAYFKSHDYKLGKTQNWELRTELQSAAAAKDWFRKEALFVIEGDHQLSVERVRKFEEDLIVEFYILKKKEDKSAQDISLMIRLVAQFQAIQETKTSLFGATPMIQEWMEERARREEEQEKQEFAE